MNEIETERLRLGPVRAEDKADAEEKPAKKPAAKKTAKKAE